MSFIRSPAFMMSRTGPAKSLLCSGSPNVRVPSFATDDYHNPVGTTPRLLFCGSHIASLVSALFSKSECLESLSTQISDVMPFLSHHSRFSKRGIHLFLGCRFDGKVVARLPFPSHSCLESPTVTCPAKTSTNVL